MKSAYVLIGALLFFVAPSLAAQATQKSPGVPVVKACSLLTKAEVKKHLPWRDLLDQFPVEEEMIGTTGSSCNYPSVFIQVMPATPNFLPTFQKSGATEPVTGVGDEAYFRNNKNNYAEVAARVGKYTLTVQANADAKTMNTVKAGAVSLAKALAAKLLAR